ncbi:MAG: hypothetical protein QM762_24815 [Chryseolinea sp.]
MKNPFFNLPDFGGELLDFRLALRLIVRQAFKPVLGVDENVIPRHTVAPVQKTAFILSLKQSLRNKIQIISQNALRFNSIFPAMKPTVKAVAAKPVQGKPVAGKSAGRKSMAKPAGNASTVNQSKGLSNGSPKALGKSVNKNAAKNGKHIAANTKRAVNVTRDSNRVSHDTKSLSSNTQLGGNNMTSAPRVVHPVAPQPDASQAKVRDGMWVEYNKHAVVIARGNYVNNLKTGLWREYYDTGELMIEEHFVLGVQHGRFATYHPNGQCCSDGMYEEGRREGQFFLYDEDGRHMRSLTFKRDVLIEDVIIEQRLAMA